MEPRDNQRTVKIVCRPQHLRDEIQSAFRDAGFSVLPPGDRTPATFAVIHCNEPGDVCDFKAAHSVDYPLCCCDTAPNGLFLKSVYEKGAYRCIFKNEGSGLGAIASELVVAARQTLGLARLMEGADARLPAWIETVMSKLDVGISVVDRGFRVWYRNEKHKKMVPSQNKCLICWMHYHGLVEEVAPCATCPARDAMEEGVELIEPKYMAVGCSKNDKRESRLTRVRALPLKCDGMIVGAIEEVRDATDDILQKQEPPFECAIEGLLRSAFQSNFARARLFVLSPDNSTLHGHTSIGKPEPDCDIRSVHIPVCEPPDEGTEKAAQRGESRTLPDKPVVRSLDQMDRSEVQYMEYLDKENARYWGDLPVYGANGQCVGKVVVDRWNADDPKGQLIKKEDISGYDKALGLIGQLIVGSDESQESLERIAVATGMAQILSTADPSSPGSPVDALLEALGLLREVVSAVVRAPKKRGTSSVLSVTKGFGAYRKSCLREVPAEGGISGDAFRSRQPTQVLPTNPDRLRLDPDLGPPPQKVRDELDRIRYQQSYPLLCAGADPVAVLSLQCSSAQCLVNDNVGSLVRATCAAISGQSARRFGRDLVSCLLAVLQLHDIDTADHCILVGKISELIAQKLGRVDPRRARLAGCLHDIGKVGLCQSLVRGHTRLTAGEWAYVRAHVDLGQEVLKRSPGLEDICRAATEHHMWYDGSSVSFR